MSYTSPARPWQNPYLPRRPDGLDRSHQGWGTLANPEPPPSPTPVPPPTPLPKPAPKSRPKPVPTRASTPSPPPTTGRAGSPSKNPLLDIPVLPPASSPSYTPNKQGKGTVTPWNARSKGVSASPAQGWEDPFTAIQRNYRSSSRSSPSSSKPAGTSYEDVFASHLRMQGKAIESKYLGLR